MELTGIIEDMSIDYKSGKPKVTFILNERECINQLEKIKVDMCKYDFFLIFIIICIYIFQLITSPFVFFL